MGGNSATATSETHAGSREQHGSVLTSHPNPSLQVTADHRVLMAEAPVHAPGPGEVLLHIKATGVCGYVRRQQEINPSEKHYGR
ncbi:hypothetical protein IMZ48_19495 [Candidatus Bathyarchaeota archaeon]|nr:hypothetical protein [Candidatus Bathyarchaeota archaeon]